MPRYLFLYYKISFIQPFLNIWEMVVAAICWGRVKDKITTLKFFFFVFLSFNFLYKYFASLFLHYQFYQFQDKIILTNNYLLIDKRPAITFFLSQFCLSTFPSKDMYSLFNTSYINFPSFHINKFYSKAQSLKVISILTIWC